MNKNENKNQYNHYQTYQPYQRPASHTKALVVQTNFWLTAHNKRVLLAVLIFIITLGSALSFMMNRSSFASETKPLPAIQKPQKFYSPLTGAPVSETETRRPVTAVMIENTPEARPQAGLKEAGVVYESVAEAGITRFLMLYQESSPKLIGPVRSVRPQFASWAAAYDAGLAHVGGSDIPLKKLRSGQIRDLDQFFNANAYWRSKGRQAPHNVYTNDEKLQALNRSKNYASSKFSAWKRSKKTPVLTTPTARIIAVPVSTGLYSVNYNWDQASGSYLRSQGGAPHKDQEAGQLAPAVVLVLQVRHDVIRDSNNFSYPDVIGSGKGWLFQNGIVSEINWQKSSDKQPVVLSDAAGKELVLNAGQTWITAIKPDRSPSWQ